MKKILVIILFLTLSTNTFLSSIAFANAEGFDMTAPQTEIITETIELPAQEPAIEGPVTLEGPAITENEETPAETPALTVEAPGEETAEGEINPEAILEPEIMRDVPVEPTPTVTFTKPSAEIDPLASLRGLDGKYDIDLFTGAATFNYPISIPEGRGGMKPNVSMRYSSLSQKFGSIAGYGWELPTNAIFRSSPHGVDQLYTDSIFSADIFGSTQELVATNDAKTLYGAKYESNFTKFEFVSNYWVATDTRGTKYFFGQSAASKNINPDDSSQVYKWMLDRVEDLNGNFMTLTYFQDSGQVYPDTIRYTGHGSESGNYEIKFLREDKINYPTSYITGFKVETKYRIGAIKISSYHAGSAAEIRTYDFDYNETGTVVDTLKSITVKKGSESLPPTSFEYFDGSEGISGQKIHLMKKIIYSLGGESELRYKPSTAYRTAAQDVANPNLPFTIHTINTVSLETSADSPVYTTTYDYSGGHYYFDYADAYKKEYAGFHEVSLTDPDGNKTNYFFHQSEFSVDNAESATQSEYADHISKKGKIYREEERDVSGNLFHLVIRKWDKRDLAVNRFYPFLSREVELDYDGNSDYRAKAASYDYDDYGNIITKTNWGEVTLDDQSGNFSDILNDKVTQKLEYAQNNSKYLFALVKRSELKDFTGNLIGEKKIYYDGLTYGDAVKGNATKTESLIKADPAVYAVNQAEYNSYGLLTKTTNPRGFDTLVVYDDLNLYPKTITNALGQTVNYEYNYLFGSPAKEIGLNGEVKINEFDNFGRIASIKITDPNNTGAQVQSTAYTYDLSARPASIATKVFTGQVGIEVDSKTYFDGFGREVQKKTEAEGESKFVVSSKTYDSRGNVKKEFLPKFSTTINFENINSGDLGNEYTYDVLNRVTKKQNNLGATLIAYDNWSDTTTDANGKKKKLAYDAYEDLIEVHEFLNGQEYITRYDYDALGNLIKITDALGNSAGFKYDIAGRKIEQEMLHRPNAASVATSSFAYDENNNLISSKNFKGEEALYEYDSLDRQTKEKFAGQVITEYFYDAGDNAIGKLSSVKYNGGEKSFTYDKLGRVISDTKKIDDKTFTTATKYDLVGNILELDYPGSEALKVQYEYNNAGQINKVNKNNESVVNNFDYGIIGAPEIIEYANGVVTTSTFDPNQLLRLTHKVSRKGDVALQDISYEFDPVGNVLKITDASATKAAKIASYEYDDLYRLTKASISDSAVGATDYVQTYAYDIIGNILNRSDVGDYKYEGAHPHQVTSAGAKTYTYDANGNLISDGVWTHVFNYKNQLVSSTSGTKTVTYAYDDSGDRVKKIGPDNKEALYAGKLFEIENGEERQFIFSGDLKLATKIKLAPAVVEEVKETTNPACVPPVSGDWNVTKSCVFTGKATAPANVIVATKVVLTIAPDALLEVNLKTKKLLVKKGGGVLIKQGGTIAQTGKIIAPAPAPTEPTPSSTITFAYHHTDHLSGANVDTDSNGVIIELLDYYPFGNVRLDDKSEGYANDYKYTGKELDEDTGLYYYGARYYDAGIGRFVSLDPAFKDIGIDKESFKKKYGKEIKDVLSNPQELNNYSYVANNPLRYIDPSGESLFSAALKVLGVCGKILGPLGYAYDILKPTNTVSSDQDMTPKAIALNNKEGSGLGSVGIVAGSIAKNGDDVSDVLNLGEKKYSVYTSKTEEEVVEYVGMTNNMERRSGEWSKEGRMINKLDDLPDLTSKQARGVEQFLIEYFGLNNLSNKINSISAKNSIYEIAKEFGEDLLKSIKYIK